MCRAELPDASTLVRDVQNVDLDLEMANSEQEKAQLEDQKMSKTWRALRLMSKTKLNLFDKVDDGKNLACFLQEQDDEKADGEAMVTEKEEPNGDENAKEDDEPMADEELKTETNGSPTVVAAGTS
jgi:THO complex subunit 1